MKTIKISALDSVFSKLVRAAGNWTCARCKKQYPENSQGLHASHIWGRSKRSTRWLPLNVVPHCMGCHARLGGNPFEFRDWVIQYYGPEVSEHLERIAKTPIKLTKQDVRDIYDDYRAQAENFQPGDDIETPAVLLLKIRSAGL